MPRSLPALANDCLHMVVNNDPGLKAFLASNASPETKASRYLVLLTRSRFDVYPAGERDADRHAQRRLRTQSSGARARQHQGTAARSCG
jgi:hypothetical protein